MPSSSGDSGRNKDADKDDEKNRGLGGISGVTKGLGGITSRFGGGDKSSEKPATPKSGGSPLANVTKGLGGITSRFGGGDKSSEKPATPKSGGSPLSSVTKGLGGLTSRFGVGKKDDKAASKSPTSSFGGGSPSSASRSPLGSRSGMSSSGTSSTSAASRAAPKVSFAERIKTSLPFLGGKETKKTPSVRERAEKASKAPRVDQTGLSLDNKLDILGVVLLLGSLALFFSSMSATKGQLTEAINTFLAQLLGWGAIAVPFTMFAAGLWLIIRHFGDQAPVIQPTRIIGLAIVYIGMLVLFQYGESFNDLYRGIDPSNLTELQLQLEISYTLGRGGGWLGAQLYLLLVTNITEYGMVVSVIGMIFIGAMLLLRISAAEIAVFFISIGRSFFAARQRRVQARQAAARLAAAQAAAIAAQQVSVSKPNAGEIAAPKSPALPTPSETPNTTLPLPEPRPIPITMGGKTVTAFFDNNESVPAETASTAAGVQPPAAKSTFAARLRGAVPSISLPGSKGAEASKPETPKPAAEKEKSGGLLPGRLFNRPGASPAEKSAASTQKPETTTAAAAKPAPVTIAASQSPPAPSTSVSPVAPKPAPSLFTADGEEKPEDAAPVRLGELMKPSSTSPAAVSGLGEAKPSESPSVPLRETIRPFQAVNGQSLRTTPPEDLDADEDEDEDDEQLANLEPAKPKGTGPLPRPQSPWAKPVASSPPVSPSPPGEMGSLAERRERLNAIRTGQLSPGTPDKDKPDAAGTSAATPPAATFGAPSRPASQSAYPSDEISRPKPVINIIKDDEKTRMTPAEATIANATPLPPKPAADPSPAFKKPDTPPLAAVSSGMPVRKARKNWKLPDYKTLLNTGSETDMDREQLLARARTIEETLQSFGAPGRVVEVNTGPVITQFGVEPDYLVMRSGKKNRVKVGAIAQLDKDLQLALGAKSIRIEAPVPGKGYVGIEVPNDEASVVSLRDVMDSDAFKKIRAKSPLAIALGQSVDGAPIAADLASMPHLLIAGTTGSGKSVLVNAIIAGLILNNTPDKVKFIMVDPKRVELTGYNGIPHLVAPVVVDLERIVGVLKWVTREMDERYKQFSNAGARNIEDFNKHLSPEQDQMPYIVVIIDELADLMMLAPDETERVITRIAALARATGIHLVIATQRPSVDVVTGLIKANFPARIAFAVAGGVDSRVILDQPGAEKLLGRGDMLYLSGDSPAPLRLQGVFLSDTEINNITRYWKMFTAEDEPARPITALVLDDEDNEKPRDVMPRSMSPIAQQAFWDDSPKTINGKLVANEDDDDEGLTDGQDELYDQAVEMVRRLNKASVSLLQRRLRIGYTRAARLIDMMEEEGIVGPAQEGSKPREVLPLKG
jgi:DNA segregation ATPase FtsK/SpoIIIE-like protein